MHLSLIRSHLSRILTLIILTFAGLEFGLIIAAHVVLILGHVWVCLVLGGVERLLIHVLLIIGVHFPAF